MTRQLVESLAEEGKENDAEPLLSELDLASCMQATFHLKLFQVSLVDDSRWPAEQGSAKVNLLEE